MRSNHKDIQVQMGVLAHLPVVPVLVIAHLQHHDIPISQLTARGVFSAAYVYPFEALDQRYS